jgi:glycosyltransferase involved in cell wall biosynthesis
VPLTVSVALCTHNGELYVAEQVASILGQSLAPAEIVLSDDASTDGTVAAVRRVVDGFAASNGSAPMLRVIENATALGVAGNFAQAIAATSGDLVALSDQDDVWHPERLERLAAAFDREPGLALVHSDARLVDGTGADAGVGLLESLEVTPWERAEIHAGRAFDVFLRRNLVTGATAVASRGLVDVALPVPPGWIHDEWLAIVGAAIGRVDLLEEKLTDYRQHGGNQIGARKPTLRDKISRLREPRAERNANLLERARSLVTRLEGLGSAVPPADLELARAKLVHEEFRSALPASRPRRVIPVLREGAQRYARFSRGRADRVRDILQPA